MAKARRGRASIFRDKDLTPEGRRAAQLTEPGKWGFERQRKALAKLAGVEYVVGENPSNSDTIEFMARGVEGTRRYLNSRK